MMLISHRSFKLLVSHSRQELGSRIASDKNPSSSGSPASKVLNRLKNTLSTHRTDLVSFLSLLAKTSLNPYNPHLGRDGFCCSLLKAVRAALPDIKANIQTKVAVGDYVVMGNTATR
jgi:hypothetical protein